MEIPILFIGLHFFKIIKFGTNTHPVPQGFYKKVPVFQGFFQGFHASLWQDGFAMAVI
ncbi:hypothetical protein [Desulfamplus magnetovallimortis]|uniref:hypothetical protein n=1 Tax=Desulfamplus magnetovallimortis TaxID=1246637 RepID=UPI00164621B4|nr:hypothetical protein [Desulfamplus magnetovallimortis]